MGTHFTTVKSVDRALKLALFLEENDKIIEAPGIKGCTAKRSLFFTVDPSFWLLPVFHCLLFPSNYEIFSTPISANGNIYWADDLIGCWAYWVPAVVMSVKYFDLCHLPVVPCCRQSEVISPFHSGGSGG